MQYLFSLIGINAVFVRVTRPKTKFVIFLEWIWSFKLFKCKIF